MIMLRHILAHLLTVANRVAEEGDTSSNSGRIVSRTVGGVSVSYQLNSSISSLTDDSLMSTLYGERFLIVRNQTFIPAFTARTATSAVIDL